MHDICFLEKIKLIVDMFFFVVDLRKSTFICFWLSVLIVCFFYIMDSSFVYRFEYYFYKKYYDKVT